MTSADPQLPAVVVVGAPKTGTSSLWSALGNHPNLFTSSKKELNYFIEEINLSRGLPWYREQYAGIQPGEVGVDVSPQYCRGDTYSDIPRRMHDLLPEARLVFVARDPIKRIRSEYRHRVARGKEPRSLERAVLEDPIYVTTSQYTRQIERFLEYYPRQALLVLPSRHFFGSPTLDLPRLWEHIGIPTPPAPLPFANVNPGSRKKSRPKLLRGIARIPGYKKLGKLVPGGLRRRWRSATSADLDPSRFEMPETVRVELGRRLSSDVAAFADFVETPAEMDWLDDPVYA